MKNEINRLIQNYLETENEYYFNELLNEFKPLINKYTKKLYYLDYEDCIQELNIAFIMLLLKLKILIMNMRVFLT